jgi:thiol-disulfide isomerase/thioredoxin
MRNLMLLFCFLVLQNLHAQNIPAIKAAQLTDWKNAENDTLYVLNFWASWCAPCVAEIPSFLALHQKYAAQKVKVILVDCDFNRDLETKVKPFIQQKHLEGLVVHIAEKDPNTWVDLVSKEWSGALPGTLLVCKSRNVLQFYEKKFEDDELEAAVKAVWPPK